MRAWKERDECRKRWMMRDENRWKEARLYEHNHAHGALK